MDVMRTNRRVLTAREAALDALVAVEAQGAYSNLALHRVLPRTSPRDKALATELVYGTLKRQNTLDWFLARLLTRPLAELALWVKVLLRLSLYQLYYLTRVPSHAVVYEAVEIAKRRGHKGIAALVNGVLRRAVREGKQPLVSPDLPELARKALELSHPEALIARWEDVYGPEETRAMCEANNAPAPVHCSPRTWPGFPPARTRPPSGQSAPPGETVRGLFAPVRTNPVKQAAAFLHAPRGAARR